MDSPRQLQVVTTRPRPLHEDFDASSRNGANGNGRSQRLPVINGKVVDPRSISAELEELFSPPVAQ